MDRFVIPRGIRMLLTVALLILSGWFGYEAFNLWQSHNPFSSKLILTLICLWGFAHHLQRSFKPADKADHLAERDGTNRGGNGAKESSYDDHSENHKK